MSKFYRLNKLEVSEDGQWAIARKDYWKNKDTILLFNLKKKDTKPLEVTGMNQQQAFIGRQQILGYGSGMAKLVNLKTGAEIKYQSVQEASALPEIKQYLVLDNKGTLTVHNDKGNILYKVSNILHYVTDSKKAWFAYQKTEGKSELIYSIEGKIQYYKTDNAISHHQMSITPSGRYLTLTETEKESGNLKLTLIDTTTGSVHFPMGIPSVKADMVKVFEIQNGKAYLITFPKAVSPPSKKLVDIWYENDNNLRAKNLGTHKIRYWLWHSDTNNADSIPSDRFSEFSSFDSDRYLLAFRPYRDYVIDAELADVYLYDTVNQSYDPIFQQSTKIVASSGGNYMTSFSSTKQQWQLFDVDAKEQIVFKENDLRNPIFSLDNAFVFFESNSGLLQYDIKQKRINLILTAAAKDQITIENYQYYRVNPLLGIEIKTINLNLPVLIRKNWNSDNRTAYFTYFKGDLKAMMTPTDNKVSAVKYDSKMKKILAVEENYNIASKLSITDTKRLTKTDLYRSSNAIRDTKSLKQDIIHFTNSKNVQLKGVLYYPTNFDPLKKYPMIVHIYQIQSKLANNYPFPEYSVTGFNLRSFIEKGYFVYMPDTVTDSRGPGISVLDCVNAALDTLKDHPNIEKSRTGLMGQSFGGYETDFIATQSDRFAAYISGAGISDIVKSYFSLNYNSYKPNYSIIEEKNGQYRMDCPFSEDKELYDRNNPINYVQNVSSPILLWAGLKDKQVEPDHTMGFYIGLKRNNKDVITLLYPNGNHSMLQYSEEIKDLNIRTFEWWDYFLKDKKGVPWIEKQMKPSK
ncbi:alpha/beta hydrolase family protein [Chryseobacterium sp. c4a]|uniref:alpha/beta hydrolase family protein n=1 Tax=Chryseobacterium sp. c4a TaxID=1573582 RepID=UPI00135C6D33|nr:prolyl oligopeptidase family serine peptidase [Chryseobacterium sp. c4a]